MPLVQEDYAAIGEYVRTHLNEALRAGGKAFCKSDQTNRPLHDLVLWLECHHGRSDHSRVEVDLKIYQLKLG